MASYALPSKTYHYLRRLLLNYEHSGPLDLANIIGHGSVAVDVDTDRQYYNGDLFGHDVVIYLPAAIIAPISISKQALLYQPA
jgi:hypothetical protein